MNRRKQSGFTLVEITIILLVLAILGTILLPMLEEFVDLARLARVREDIGALAAMVEKWKYDNCTRWFKVDGDSNVYDDTNRVDMLVGDGDIPNVALALAGEDDNWNEALDVAGAAGAVFVDTIEHHLASGDPFGPGNAGDPYPIPKTGKPFECGFRGAYISTPVFADPWGNRYMINVAFLGPRGTTRTFGTSTQVEFNNYDVFVLSAGADETVQTEWQFGTPPNPVGLVTGGDDHTAIVSGGSQ